MLEAAIITRTEDAAAAVQQRQARLSGLMKDKDTYSDVKSSDDGEGDYDYESKETHSRCLDTSQENTCGGAAQKPNHANQAEQHSSKEAESAGPPAPWMHNNQG